jgi:hypothetical protein
MPRGRYIAPADSFDCIETIRGLGECGQRSVVVTGPLFKQFDFSVTKRVALSGQVNAEFHIDVLNAFNNVNFAPVTGMTIPTGAANFNRSDGSNPDDYAITALTGTNTARVVQLLARIRW